MGLKASCQVRFLTSLPSNLSLKKRGQQLKRMYSAMPEAVNPKAMSSSSSSGTSTLKLLKSPSLRIRRLSSPLTYVALIVFTVNLRLPLPRPHGDSGEARV